jgi:hypothetical protein
MRKIVIAALASLFFFSIPTFAQQNFQSGYIINLNGDTVRGKIDYRNWSFNPSKITFASSSGMTQEFRPLEIKGFFVSDDLYKSAIVDKEMSGFLKGTHASSPELVLRKDTTFLRALTSVAGKNIYHFKTRENIDQFYIPKGNEFELLSYKKYKMTNAKGLQAETENKRYIGQLVLYLNGCETIQSKLKSMRYSASSFEDLMLYYQECLNPGVQQVEPNLRAKMDIGILAGFTSMSVKFTGDESLMQHYLSTANWSPSTAFSVGGFANFILPRSQGRWVLANELLMISATNLKSSIYEQRASGSTKVSSNFGMSYVKLNNLVRYRFPISTAHGFLNLGISNGKPFNVTNKQHVHTESFGQIRDQDQVAMNGFRQYEFGFLAGAGLQGKRLTMEVRYEHGDGFSEMATLNCTTTRVHVLFGVKINR